MSSGEQAAPEVLSPDNEAASSHGSWTQYVRLVVMILVIVLAAVTGLMVAVASSDPTEAQLREQAGLTGKRELLIGVGSDRPGLSHLGDDGQYRGFEIDIAYMIAAELGFHPSAVTFLSVKTEDREIMQGSDGRKWIQVDLVIATYSITRKREELEDVMFSAPYLRTKISVVTRTAHPNVASVEDDLNGERLCTLGTGTAEDEFGGVKLMGRPKIADCIDGLRDGRYDAVLTDAAILAGWVDRYSSELRQHDISTNEVQRYGVNVGDNEPLRELVNLALYCSLHDPSDGRWEDAFRKHLAPLQEANRPQQIAESEQPEKIPEPRVRRYPWEYWVPGSWAYEERPARCN
jgi:glutamate transport system substrate-binding protein